jgi:superfamily II DNA or RNA helicase
MSDVEDKIIDNESLDIEEYDQGSVVDIFDHYSQKAESELTESNFRIDIGTGWLFFSGFQETHDAFRRLLDAGVLDSVEDDEDWGTAAPIRVVMGKKTGQYTKRVLTDLIRDDISNYDDDTIQLLREFIQRGLIDFRIIKDRKFHPKIYSFYLESQHPDDIWSGSANFSRSGLSDNIELCVPMQTTYSTRQQFRGWFDKLWELGEPDLDVLEVLESSEDGEFLYYSPTVFFAKLIKLLDKQYLLEDAPGTEDELLLDFQDLTYNIVMNRLQTYGGYILANSVGTGKTYVACQTASTYLKLNPTKKALVVSPANVMDEWEDTLEEFEIEDQVDIESMGVFEKPHRTEADDINYQFDERRFAEEYSLIIVDEAHGYRNDSNRRNNLEEVIKRNPNAHVLLTTATPINLSPEDLFQLIDIFRNGSRKEKFKSSGLHQKYVGTKRDFEDLDNYNNFGESLLKNIKEIEQELSIKITWRIIQQEFEEDLRELAGEDVTYEDPEVQEINYTYPDYIKEGIFEEIVPFLEDLHYEPAKLWSGKGYQASKNLIFLQKWRLYKQLESSIAAFHTSIEKLYARNQIYYNALKNRKALEEGDVESFVDSSGELNELLGEEGFYDLVRQEKDRRKTMIQTFEELEEDLQESILERIEKDAQNTRQILQSIEEHAGNDVPRNGDQKADEMVDLVRESLENDNPVLIFSEFVPSVEYINDYLKEKLPEYSDKIDYIHGSTGRSKKKFVDRFEDGEIDVAITTDMLSEGVNIPRADVVVNYDLPYNPTKLVQRTGRALRITNPKKIQVRNFTPDSAIDKELDLYDRLDARLDSILQIAGLDFVVWMMDEKKVQTLHEEERDEYLTHLKEYNEELSQENPEKVVEGSKAPGIDKTDRIFRKAVNRFDIDNDLLDDISEPKNKPIYTTLELNHDQGDEYSDLTVVGRSGSRTLFWESLKETLVPNPSAPEASQGLSDEDVRRVRDLQEEQEERLLQEKTAAEKEGRSQKQLNDNIREAKDRLEDSDMRSTLDDVREGIENDAYTVSQLNEIETACEDIEGYRPMVKNIDEVVKERESWKKLKELAEMGSDRTNDGSRTDIKAVIKYTNQKTD